MTRWMNTTCSAVLLAGIAGCASGSSNASPPPSADTTPSTPAARPDTTPKPDSITWLVSDSASRTAVLTLEVTRPAGASSAFINGYRAGKARVIVPVGWTVKWSWRNADAASPHSLVVMVQREKIPLEGGRPSFSNAMTRSASTGLAAGQTDQTTFEAEEAGWYWMLCGVSGHALEGEWIELRVDPEAKGARLELKS